MILKRGAGASVKHDTRPRQSRHRTVPPPAISSEVIDSGGAGVFGTCRIGCMKEFAVHVHFHVRGLKARQDGPYFDDQ